MIFKKKAIYKGTKYIRVAGEDYTEFIPNIRCEIYNCKYKREYGYECIMCNQVMKRVHANKINITLGYIPIE